MDDLSSLRIFVIIGFLAISIVVALLSCTVCYVVTTNQKEQLKFNKKIADQIYMLKCRTGLDKDKIEPIGDIDDHTIRC